MDMNRFFEKITSGRWILTVIVSIILVILVLMPNFISVEKNVDKVLNIIELVVVFYFLREDRKKEENGSDK